MTVSKADKDIQNAIAHRGENGGLLPESRYCLVPVERLDELEHFAEIGRKVCKYTPYVAAGAAVVAGAALWVTGVLNVLTLSIGAAVLLVVKVGREANAGWY